ncbi:MAG: ABC transporter ATP-binding protein [Lachnospiraceae bacterium]|nr:ABC transporter ATP-binding protein [Lachnospiraceae bacterium]
MGKNSDVSLELISISKAYKKKTKTEQVLDHVSLSVKMGDFLGIVGKSGAGKTTLLNIIGLLSDPTEGNYYINGRDVTKIDEKTKARFRNEIFGFALQDYALIDNYTVYENVEIPLNYADKNFSKQEKRKMVMDMLLKLGMEAKMDELCNQLSGGQRQRVAIARALINSPDVIIADEPTGAMDCETAMDFLQLLHKINIELNKTIIMVTHDESMLQFCSQVYEINNKSLYKIR